MRLRDLVRDDEVLARTHVERAGERALRRSGNSRGSRFSAAPYASANGVRLRIARSST